MAKAPCPACRYLHRFDTERMLEDPAYRYDPEKLTCDKYPEGIPPEIPEGRQECPYCEE